MGHASRFLLNHPITESLITEALITEALITESLITESLITESLITESLNHRITQSLAHSAHTLVTNTRPNNPVGLNSSTPMINTSATVSFNSVPTT